MIRTPDPPKRAQITRDALYAELWSTPAQDVAKRLGVSGSYLARICSALNVPRPPRGYWAKKAVGKASRPPGLRPAAPGDQRLWIKENGLTLPTTRQERPVPSLTSARVPRPALHPLLRGAEEQFRKSYICSDEEFLRPSARRLPDVSCSASGLRHSLDVANKLYQALERCGFHVRLAPPEEPKPSFRAAKQEVPSDERPSPNLRGGVVWVPSRSTVAYVGPLAVNLVLTEMTEAVELLNFNGHYLRDCTNTVARAAADQHIRYWPERKSFLSGRCRILAYAPAPYIYWSQTWDETPGSSITTILPKIVNEFKELHQQAPNLIRQAVESADTARKLLEIEEQKKEQQRLAQQLIESVAHESRLRARDAQRVSEAQTASKRQLEEIIAKWAAAEAADRFLRCAEMRLDHASFERRPLLQKRLDLAKEVLGRIDALDHLESWLSPSERYQTQFPPDDGQ